MRSADVRAAAAAGDPDAQLMVEWHDRRDIAWPYAARLARKVRPGGWYRWWLR